MQTSEYFDLGLYEGTDIFNPLIVENENIEKIDEQMFLNSIAGVGQATELKSGTVHAITRVNPDASMFRFVATSKFDRGDTFTVDGIQVTGLRTDGKALDDGAYVINANVLCCLTGTVLTLFVATGDVAKADDADRLGGELPAYYGTASDVQQAVTVAQAAGVLANNLQGQVTTINSNLSELETKVDGIKPLIYDSTWTQLVQAKGTSRVSFDMGFETYKYYCISLYESDNNMTSYNLIGRLYMGKEELQNMVVGRFVEISESSAWRAIMHKTGASTFTLYTTDNSTVYARVHARI